MDIEQRPVHRILAALVGIGLLLAAVAALWLGEGSALLRTCFALVSAALGIDALRGAWSGRPSWISRLGPLP